jgi:hypothetical protein
MTPDKALADLKDNCDHFVDAPPNCWYCEVAAVITEQQSKLDQIRQVLASAGYDAKFNEKNFIVHGVDVGQIPELRVINEIRRMLWPN